MPPSLGLDGSTESTVLLAGTLSFCCGVVSILESFSNHSFEHSWFASHRIWMDKEHLTESPTERLESAGDNRYYET